MTTADKQEQKNRIGSICQGAHTLFVNECSRELPKNEEEIKKLIEKCWSYAEIAFDFIDDKYRPFI
jgi:hypothetical protein